MIKGSLDHVTEHWAAGWIYCEDIDLTHRPVLAFVGQLCVGSGGIEIVRPDLERAGMGDRAAGFGFNITLASAMRVEDVYVKLEGSDLILAQKAWFMLRARGQ